MFGWTEGFLATMTRPDDPLDALASTVGFVSPGHRGEARGRGRQPVPQANAGRNVERAGRTSALATINNPEAAHRQWDEDGWFHSATCCDRTKTAATCSWRRADDIINRGGTKVDPKSVEDACARSTSAVQNVAVVGAPDPTLGQQTVACIVLKEGAKPFTLPELREFLAAQGLAKFQFPGQA